MENRDTGYFGANGYDIFMEQGEILSARPNTNIVRGIMIMI
jgi:hypothetical protein